MELKVRIARDVSKFAVEAEALYKHLGWKWYDSDETPTSDEIFELTMGLVESLLEDPKADYNASGGIKVSRGEEDEIEIAFEAVTGYIFLNEEHGKVVKNV